MNTSKESIYELLLNLVRIPSVSPGPGEVEAARFIHNKLGQLPYFERHKQNLKFIPVKDDPLGRKAVFAIVEAEPKTDRTIIFTGHFDVVDTSESRTLRDVAFEPEEYTKRVSELGLPKEAAEDLESGKYLFGRGVMDMKCGLAIQMSLLAEYSEDPKGLPINIAFLAVGDEENNSAGMRAAISFLASLQESGTDFVACINSEGVIPKYPGDTNRYVDTGTIGKIMPLFYCVGRESHVGQYYAGLNANLMSSAINKLLEGNSDWAESWNEEVYPPPTALKHKDLRQIYSVTLPARSFVYFNHLTVTSTPLEILAKMKNIAERAFESVLSHLKESAETFSEKAETPVPIPWKAKVMTVQELTHTIAGDFDGSLDKYLRSFVDGLPENTDERDKSLYIIGELLRMYPDKDPMIIIGFLPPYYPHRTNKKVSTREKEVIEAINSLINETKEKFDETLVISEHFASISDLSYVGFQGKREELLPLANNTPGWGLVYDIPIDDLLKLDIPALNLGPSGKDAHKFIERLELNYSLEIVPILLKSLVDKLSRIP